MTSNNHNYREINPNRELSVYEKQILEKLMAEDFPGCQELRQQLPYVKVSAECVACPSVVFKVEDRKTTLIANVAYVIPVEGMGEDLDHMIIHILLFVVDGFLDEMEYIREDGEQIIELPSCEAIQVLYLD